MFIQNFWIYAGASFLLLIAHVIRSARWALLFPPSDINRRFDLLLGLSLGYAINAVIPWRPGELLRIWFAANKTAIRISHVASTVMAERLADLIAVSAIVFFINIKLNSTSWQFPLIAISLSLVIIGLCYGVRTSNRTRFVVWKITSIFNNQIRNSLLDLVWSFSEMVLGGALVKPRFLVTTVAMWAMYLLSYATFAQASGNSLTDVVFTMLGSPLKPVAEPLIGGEHSTVLVLLAFTCFPIAGVLFYGGMKQLPAIVRILNARRRYGWYTGQGVLRRARSHFKGEAEYEYFLASLFSGSNKVATSFGLGAIDDGKVHKLFSGGSDAITAVVEVNERLLIRKFAVGPAAIKLKAQHDWFGNYRSDHFPLVKVLCDYQTDQSYHYDMPLVVASSDFYDFIHTNPTEGSKRVLSEVIEKITVFHNEHMGATADNALVKRYLQEKVVANATLILNFARSFLNDHYTINGVDFNLAEWEKLLDPDWLLAQISSRSTTVVHGDLTIENIIIAPQACPNWYIIDPNPDNIFNNHLIDWSKLMQSVHLGYEGLNRNFSCIVERDAIQLPFTKSQAYTELHNQFVSIIEKQHGEDCLREIYFHELVNYLRLIPYKIRQDQKKGICFFGCASILLKRYGEQFK